MSSTLVTTMIYSLLDCVYGRLLIMHVIQPWGQPSPVGASCTWKYPDIFKRQPRYFLQPCIHQHWSAGGCAI